MIYTSELPELTGGTWIVPPKASQRLCGGCFDTRKIRNEHTFFAWRGERADGHDYIHTLAGSSVKVAIVEKNLPSYPENIAILKTSRSLHALWKMAAATYFRFTGKAIVITGSNGKTTAKMWLAETLGKFIPTHYSKKSFNNHIGYPISVLGLLPEHRVIILEVGANAGGEIDRLTELFPPDIAVILNVGYAHAGRFGGIKRTYAAKSEIINHLKPGGLLFIPNDDPTLIALAREKLLGKNVSGALRYFPEHRVDIVQSTPAGQEIELTSNSIPTVRISTDVLGKYAGNIFSLIASIANTLNISTRTVASEFSKLKNVPGRMTMKRTKSGASIIDDAYNANPNSVAHLLSAMSDWSFDEKYIVLGNMAELGDYDEKTANIIMDALEDSSIRFFTFGDMAKRVGRIIEKKTSCTVKEFATIDDLIKGCKKRDRPGVLFGVKGSNAERLWRVTDALTSGS